MKRTLPLTAASCMIMGLLLWSCAVTASSPSAKDDGLHNRTAGSMKKDSGVVLQLRLTFSEKLTLRASARNVSSDTVVFLVHPLLMPSKLTLRNALGLAVKAKDKRSMMRFDTRISRDAFVNLAPGEERTLATGVFSGSAGDGYRLTWDAFDFSTIKPGTYSAKVEWESVNDQYYDRDAGSFVTLPGVWKGTVVSPTIKIKLPGN